EGGAEGGGPAPLATVAEPGGAAALEILLERAGEPAPYEGGAASERTGLARAGGEEHERLQELGAPGDAEHGVLAPVEVVGERDGLPGLVAEVIAHVRHAVGDRAGHVLHREGSEEATGATSSRRVHACAIAASRSGAAAGSSSPHGMSTAGAQRRAFASS